LTRPSAALATIVLDGAEVLLDDVLERHGVSRAVYRSRLALRWDPGGAS
jgi:hypothetical protein